MMCCSSGVSLCCMTGSNAFLCAGACAVPWLCSCLGLLGPTQNGVLLALGFVRLQGMACGRGWCCFACNVCGENCTPPALLFAELANLSWFPAKPRCTVCVFAAKHAPAKQSKSAAEPCLYALFVFEFVCKACTNKADRNRC